MNNYRTIIESFEGFVEQHPVLQTFTWGDLSDVGRENDKIKYPILHVIPQPSTLEKTYTDFVFNMIIGDMLNEDESNQLDVLKTSHLILQDFAAYYINQLTDNTFELLTPITFSPFLDRLDDVLCGVESTITIRVEASFCL